MAYACLSPEADLGVMPQAWLEAEADEIAREAASHYGACDDGDIHPDELDWQLVIDFPVSALLPLMTDRQGWDEWFAKEVAMHELDHSGWADTYRSLMDEPLENPIVVVMEPRRVQIWDGWHRTATRILGEARTIPAIVGCRRDGPGMMDVLLQPDGLFPLAT